MTTTKAKRSRLKGRTEVAPGSVRVAIYTRKSVTEGLDQEFNTLDAQREAVEAYVASQRGEGWVALADRYDDGGFTGANTDRPAFKRLLADIEAGKVDAVAVYRTDRLSRSLLDFARLNEFFHAQGVAFISITEHFDTSTPTGRMVLNLLATFAQFERESIAQRTRDKISASRRRGMWTGGRPVLGYDVVDKKLAINEDEAERVRSIFDLYLHVGSLLGVVAELRDRAWTTKSWTNKAGDVVSGRSFNKNSLHSLLTNPLYIGKVRAGSETVDGAHDGIVDEETWRAVQDKLRDNRGGGAGSAYRANAALLAGLVRCGSCGTGMTSHYTTKGSKRYAYYVCGRSQKEGAAACPGSRVSAGELEEFVVDQLRTVGTDPALLDATLAADRADRAERRPEIEAKVRRLNAQHRKEESERRNLVDAIASGDGGGNAPHALIDRVAELDRSIEDIEREAAQARSELAALELGTIDADDLRTALADLEPIWAELFPRERSRVLALLLERVEFHGAAGDVVLAFRPGAPRGVAR